MKGPCALEVGKGSLSPCPPNGYAAPSEPGRLLDNGRYKDLAPNGAEISLPRSVVATVQNVQTQG
jgi:hypothetical protein